MIQSSFSIYPQLLVVQFTDTSIVEEGKSIDSWLWDFGDSTNSTTQNPSHTYTAPGKYKVTLTVTDSDSGSLQTIRYIMVDTKPILPVSLEDFVKMKLPLSFPYQSSQLQTTIATWQIYTQPLVNSPGVSEADALNEVAYPPIVNALIGHLSAYQLMIDYISSAAMSAAGSGIDGQEGVIKRIETGPSNAEFRDTSTYLKALSQPNGLIDQVRKQMCMLSLRTMIEVPYCPPLPKPRFISLKAGRNEPSLLNLWNMDPAETILAW